MSIIKWGIIGPGKIAGKFAADLLLLDDHELTAVASRNIDRAESFASEYQGQRAYGSYEAIMNDEDVDIIYIATPHPYHHEWTIKCLNAGKHVLCEKPLGINLQQVKDMIEASEKNQKFLMEALWSRFNPAILSVLDEIQNGIIGEPNYITADFTFYNNPPLDGRLLNPHLAGGSLLDIGIYPIFLAYQILGVPDGIKSHGVFHEKTGVDTMMSATFNYKNATAQLSSSIMTESEMVAKIAGKKGSIYIDSRWHEADGYRINTANRDEHFKIPKTGNGYYHEIIECGNCIRNEQIQSEKWSHQNSIDLIKIMDSIRKEIGLVYPFE